MRIGRQIVAVLAAFAMLVHAGLITRHHLAVLSGALHNIALAAALGELCHGQGDVTQTAGLAHVPAPDSPAFGEPCPLCAGLGPAVADVTPGLLLSHPISTATSVRIAAVSEIIAPRIGGLRPQPRAPPAVA